MKRLSFILGTRPEAIKLAPLILLTKSHPDFKIEICLTGQHREMLFQVLDVFNICPDVNLDLMMPNQSLAGFFGRALTKLDEYLKVSQPEFVIVQGDTSTVLAASLASFYNRIKVLHVEAGLRTKDLFSPYPEEMNRRLTSHLAFYHFAPTLQARNNLIKEGIREECIAITGNTSIDALIKVVRLIETGGLSPNIDNELMNAIGNYEKMVLITGHRRENFGAGFENICEAIKVAAMENSDCLFVYPVHLNPNVKSVVERTLSGIGNVFLAKPQGYVEFIYLMMKSNLILTDSGGVQEEAPSLKKPILVMRDNTERPEGIIAGCSKLVGTNATLITREVHMLLKDKNYYNSFLTTDNPYGTGTASELILNAIKEF